MLLRDCAFAQTRLSFCCSHNAHAIRNSPTIACLRLLNVYVSCGVAQTRRGIWVRCTINRSHSTPCKMAEFEHLQIFPGHCLDLFLSVSGKICHSPIKKVKRQPTLIISFSQHSPFFEEQSKNPG